MRPERPKTLTPVELATLARLARYLDAGLTPEAALLAMVRGIGQDGEGPKEGNTPMSTSSSEDHWKSAGSSPP